MNPYQAPEAGTTAPAQDPDAISSTRYVVNMGCGLAAVLFWFPVTVVGIYRLATDRTAETGTGVVLSVLFLMGCMHSVAWAMRRYRRRR